MAPSNVVTRLEIKRFLNDIEELKNGATFERCINGVKIKVEFHCILTVKPPVYRLEYYDNEKDFRKLVPYALYSTSSKHELKTDFKEVMEYYFKRL